jgi:hypothetical protein
LKMVKYLLLMLLTMIPVFACAAKMKQTTPPLQVVSYVDLNKYLGTWYEIARYPNRFQEGCVGTNATGPSLEIIGSLILEKITSTLSWDILAVNICGY